MALKLILELKCRAEPTKEPGKTLTPTLHPIGRRRPARDTGTAQRHQYLATLPLIYIWFGPRAISPDSNTEQSQIPACL